MILGFAPEQVIAALLASLVAAFVRGLAGFGMAILLVPVLALALTPVEAVLTTNVLAALLGLSEIRAILRAKEPSAIAISGWVALATAPGLWLLALTPPGIARVMIAFVALSAFAAIMLPQRAAAQPGPVHTGATGIAAGLLTGFAGMPGPPVVPFYVGRPIPRHMAKASMLLVFTVAALAGLISGEALGILETRQLVLGAALFPAVVLGNWLGAKLFGRIDDVVWRGFVALTLGAAAAAALLKLLEG